MENVIAVANEIKVNGNMEFMGIEIPVVSGGFGADKRVMTVKTIAEIHDVKPHKVNEIINNNLDEFEIGVDILEILAILRTDSELAENIGYSQSAINASSNIYILSEQGYMALVSLMRTEKAKEIRKQLRREYFSMKQELQEMQRAMALMKIMDSESDIERAMAVKNYEKLIQQPLLETIGHQATEIDKYERFVCDKLSTITKTELATKLDTKPQTLASLFKKLGVYTDGNSVKVDFLRKFPELKMIKYTTSVYYNPNTGEKKEKKDWIWTGEGGIKLVEYLVELDLVEFCENKGFKLKHFTPKQLEKHLVEKGVVKIVSKVVPF